MSHEKAEQQLDRVADRVTHYSLLALALTVFSYVALMKYQNGWLRVVDTYVLFFGGAACLCAWLPLPVKANVLIIFILIGITESLFAVMHRVVARPVERRIITQAGTAFEHIKRDSVLGFRLVPTSRVEAERFVDRTRVYKAHYTIDEFGRRVTPVGAGQRENFILFFGCSFTFGEGLEDDQTLPSFVGQLAGNFRPYNYAVGGYGPQHMLARLENGQIENEIGERPGKAVYVFIDDHVKRAMNTLRTDWVHHSPYYVMDRNGQLISRGNFNTARPYLYALYHDVLARSQTLSFLNSVDFPLAVGEGDIELVAKIIEASAKKFRDRLGSKDFYVVLHPVGSSEYGPRLAKYLDRFGIRYLDYSGKMTWTKEQFLHPTLDLHPNGLGNRAVAEKLVEDLGLAASGGGAKGTAFPHAGSINLLLNGRRGA